MQEAKDKIQKEFLNKWQSNNYKGTAHICTGGGKSKIFVDATKESEKWLLVVPTIKLRDKAWKDEFQKWNKTSIFLNNIKKTCYASLKNERLEDYDGYCFDEVHNVTVNNTKHFKNVDLTNKKVLALTATKPKDEVKQNIIYKGLKCIPLVDINLDQGVKLGIVAPYKIYIHKVPLSTSRDIKVEYKKGKTKQVFYTSEQDSYNYKSKNFEKNKESINDLYQRKYTVSPKDRKVLDTEIKKLYSKRKFIALDRMRFLNNLKSKEVYAKNLIKKYKDKKKLIFTQSISQAELIHPQYYHYKSGDEFYEKFIKDEINTLSVVKSLNEGDNIPNMDMAIIESLDSNPLNFIQRTGRIVRYRDEHQAEIHILLSSDTVQQDWLFECINRFNNDNIIYIDEGI